jgi:hypothetical protein
MFPLLVRNSAQDKTGPMTVVQFCRTLPETTRRNSSMTIVAPETPDQ